MRLAGPSCSSSQKTISLACLFLYVNVCRLHEGPGEWPPQSRDRPAIREQGGRSMKLRALLLAGAAGALFVTGAASPLVAQTEFIANSFYADQHPHTKYGYIEWAQIVEELSNGRLKPEVYTGTVLLAPRANLQGIRDNVVQVAHHAAVYTPSELPVANAVQELGFNYSDPLVAIFAVTDFSMSNETQLAEWKDKGIVYLGSYATPSYILFCRSPVRNL